MVGKHGLSRCCFSLAACLAFFACGDAGGGQAVTRVADREIRPARLNLWDSSVAQPIRSVPSGREATRFDWATPGRLLSANSSVSRWVGLANGAEKQRWAGLVPVSAARRNQGPVWVATGDSNLGRISAVASGNAECDYEVVGDRQFYAISWQGVGRGRAADSAAWYVHDFMLDVSPGQVLDVWLRAARPGTAIRIGLKDSSMDVGDAPKFGRSFRVQNRWQRVQIPLSRFQGLDFSSINAVVLQPLTPGSGTVYLDSLNFRVPPPAPTFVIEHPRHRVGVAAYDTVEGICTLPGARYVVPIVVPDGDGIAYPQERAYLGPDGEWSSYCRFGRLSSIDDGEWFTVYANALDANGRLLRRTGSIRVYRKPYR